MAAEQEALVIDTGKVAIERMVRLQEKNLIRPSKLKAKLKWVQSYRL